MALQIQLFRFVCSWLPIRKRIFLLVKLVCECKGVLHKVLPKIQQMRFQ